MLTFEQFIQKTVEKGGSINVLFEEQLFAPIGTLERIAKPLAAERIPYELIGGGAVMVQVNRVDPFAVRNTRDINLRDINLWSIALTSNESGKQRNATDSPSVTRPVLTCSCLAEKLKPAMPCI
ncbi:MAG TPA: hypothetical protein VG297_00395 [Bryobacteraceae bacterium]|nr:hypothetical protein [Bryobacteraceae bacterium]